MLRLFTICLMIQVLGLRANEEAFQKCYEQEEKLGDCCGVSNIDEEESEVETICAEELDANDQKEAYYCYTNCIFQESGWMSEDGNINLEEVLKSNEADFEIHQNEEFKNVMAAIYSACLEKVAEHKDQIMEKLAEVIAISTCDVMPTVYYSCVQMSLTRNCPGSMWNQTTECNELIQQVKEKDACLFEAE